MNNLTLIAAVGENLELGFNNALIWHLPDDLKFFKEKTNGKTIVMGYNTLLSLPKVLPNRRHLVLTKKNIKIDGVEIFNSKEELINEIIKIKEEVFIIGGASIYKQFIDEANKIYLTEIKASEKADAYFPQFNKDDYESEIIGENINNNIEFKHVLYRKKK